MSGLTLSKRFSRSGERRRSETSVGCRSSSTGSRSRISGSVLTEKVFSRASVSFVSVRNVGKIRIESARCSRRRDSSSKSSVLRTVSSVSAPSSAVSSSNVLPVFFTRSRSAARRSPSTSTTPCAFSTKTGRLPSASDRSRPRPAPACAALAIHCWNVLRVFLSKIENSSSNSTACATWPSRSRAPSLMSGAPGLPVVTSTYVSPSSVFWRRIARASAFIGAYFESSSIVASVLLPSGASCFFTTRPIRTPAVRTSAWSASVGASVNATCTR